MEKSAIDSYDLGDHHYKIGEYEESLWCFSRAIELKPDFARAYNRRGLLFENHFKKYEKALQDYNKAIELNPQNSKAYNNRGVLFENHFKKYEKALQDINKAIELNPQEPDFYYNRGFLLQHHFKKYENALQDLNKAIELNPQHLEAYNNRGFLLMNNHFKKFENALQDYNKAIELNPQEPDFYYFRGYLLSNNHFKKYEKALQDYNKAIELNPQDSDAYNNRGVLFENHFKDYEKAIQDFSKEIELGSQYLQRVRRDIRECERLQKSSAEDFFLMAMNHEKKGEQKTAFISYSKSIERNPEYIEAYFRRGLILKNFLKDYKKAMDDFSKVIELNPQHSRAHFNRGNLYREDFKDYRKAHQDYSEVMKVDPKLEVDDSHKLTPDHIQECHEILPDLKMIFFSNQLPLESNKNLSSRYYEVMKEYISFVTQLHRPNEREPQEVRNTKLNEKLEEVEERRYRLLHPTHSFSHEQKIDFDVAIGSSKKFASNFKPPPEDQRKKILFEDITNDDRIDFVFESVVVDFEKDKELLLFVEKIKEDFLADLNAERKRLKSKEFLREEEPIFEIVNKVLLKVALFFIPLDPVTKMVDGKLMIERHQNLRDHLFNLRRQKRKTNAVFLGADLQEQCGACRHRSTLCKVVCDELGIRCQLVSVSGYHAWNVIWVKDKFFIVDLMNFWHKGLIKFDEKIEYPKTKEKMSFLELQKRVVEDDYENKKKDDDYESIMKALETQILKEEIRRQREVFFKDGFENGLSSFVRLVDTESGGFGKISNYVIEETKELEDQSLIQTLSSLRGASIEPLSILFKKGEKISVKQIPILEEEEEEEKEGEDEEEEMGFTNIREGMERKYALKEKNFMRILDHSNIIKSLGSFEFEDENGSNLCVLMNSMEKNGRRFLRLLNRRKQQMSQEQKLIQVLYFLIDASQGLQYMHRMKIVHLDFKLDNIMINWDDEKKEITELRIIDFGGAKETDYRTSTTVVSVNENDSPPKCLFKKDE